MYTYQITPELVSNIYDPSGNLINWPGPWQTYEQAESWAQGFVDGLNSGSIVWPPVEETYD